MSAIKKSAIAVALTACVLLAGVPAWAQAPAAFKEGDKIEYKAQRYPEKWQEGTFVRVLDGGRQFLIRETPNEWFPEGFEKAYMPADVRKLAAPAAVPAAAPGAGGLPAMPEPGVPPGLPPLPELPAGLPPLPELPAGLPPLPELPAGLPPLPDMPQPAGNPAPVPAAAAPFAPKEGDKIEYRAVRWPEKWQVGTFVRPLDNGRQILIRETPNEWYPEGFEKAYYPEDIRPLQKPGGQDESCGDGVEAREQPAAAAPMSQDDVMAFLHARFGQGDPFRNPKREQFLDELRQEVLRRGVSFRYETLGKFSNELGLYGAVSNVRSAMSDNFGPPARIADLFGTWELMKVGAPVSYEKNNRLYTRPEWSAIAGKLVINPDGTYAWGTATEPLTGKWRPATPEELAKSDKGGDGVVLLHAKSGADWIVFKRDEGVPQGLGIKVADLETRNLRERGTR